MDRLASGPAWSESVNLLACSGFSHVISVLGLNLSISVGMVLHMKTD